MQKTLGLAALLGLVFLGCDPQAQAQSEAQGADNEPARYQSFHPADIQWQPAPPAFERGAEIAILEGDPSVEGELYTLRLKMPPDYIIAPHAHPVPERAVVVSGDFYLGHDVEVERESAERLDPGTYFTIASEMVHYVMTGSDEETILHITSTGPLELNYVDPEDDPRMR